MEKCKNVYFAAKWVKFLHKRVKWIKEGRDQREDQRGGPLRVKIVDSKQLRFSREEKTE